MSLFELFNVIREDNVSEFQKLITNHPDLLNEYLYGVTPLLYSIECNSQNISMEICMNTQTDFSLKDNIENSCLEKAIENKMYKIVEVICKNSTDKPDMNKFLENGETLLTNSLKMNDQNICLALINGGYDCNTPNKCNELPIQLAIKYNKIKGVESMLRLNQTILGTSKSGYNALLDATEKDLTEIALLLIQNPDVDVNVTDKGQLWTPLMHAITNNNEVLTKKLLEKNCEVNNQDLDGNTALHLAVMNENDYLIKLLMKFNPNVVIVNNERLTAKSLAKLIDEDLSILI